MFEEHTSRQQVNTCYNNETTILPASASMPLPPIIPLDVPPLTPIQRRETDCLFHIGVSNYKILPANIADDDAPIIDPMSENALELELSRTGAQDLSELLSPLRAKQNSVPELECLDAVNASVNWAHSMHISRESWGWFCDIKPLSTYTMSMLKRALRQVNQAIVFHKSWEYLEADLASRVERTMSSHIRALRDVVHNREETAMRLKNKLEQERDALSKLKEKTEEQEKLFNGPQRPSYIIYIMFFVVVLLQLCLLLK